MAKCGGVTKRITLWSVVVNAVRSFKLMMNQCTQQIYLEGKNKMRYTIYAYGGGNYRRYAASTSIREELHKFIDKAVDQSYKDISIKVEDT